MYSSDGRQRTIYKTLYKKYLFESQKVADQKKRNKEINSKNNELCKKLVLLREEVRKSSAKNSMMKAEIYDLAMDRKTIVNKNKKLYDTLISLHQDASAIDKRLGNILDNSSSDMKFHDIQNQSFSLPIVNGLVIENPKANIMQSESNYPRYNFKDSIYVQDLSPVMEENAEPADITRRLGHRAKVPQPYVSPRNFEMRGTVICEEDNSGSNSHYTDGITEPNRDINNLEKHVFSTNSVVLPNGIVGNSAEQSSSVDVCKNELNSTVGSESVSTSSLPEQCIGQQSAVLSNKEDTAASVSDSPILTINVLQKSNCEKTHGNPDFHPSIFVNVFPRRKKPNNLGYSLSVGDIEEEGDTDSHQEPNSTSNEKEDSKCSFKSQKSCLDQNGSESKNNSLCLSINSVNQEEATRPHSSVSATTSLHSIIDKSWIDDPSDLEFSASDKRNKKKTSKASLKSSFSDKEKTLESSKDIMVKNKGQQSRVTVWSSPESTCHELDKVSRSPTETGNKEKSSATSKRTSESSFDCSSPKKALANLSQEKKNEDRDQSVIRRSSDRISDHSPKKNISNQKASKSLQKKEHDIKLDRPSQRIGDRTAETRSKRSTSNKSSSPKDIRDLLHNEIFSGKLENLRLSSQEVTTEVDKKKSLRSKKPINFVESPVIDKKRQKVKKKTKSRGKNFKKM